MEDFSNKLLDWHESLDRPLPWKGEKDPYLIWLSEIILQQTRAEQGKPYFLKFKAAFPKVADLAAAESEQVMKLWEGLGYYSRARNLHAGAKYITEELEGQFPETYKDLLKIKGVGPYTAAAIASFAYGLPTAVVDGNVYRVLARIFGIATPIDTTKGKKDFQGLAQSLLATDKAAAYNQAIMDFGAVQCRPKSPDCTHCPFESNCYAYAHDAIKDFPKKSKKLVKKNRFFNYFICETEEQVFTHLRTAKDIWQQLHEFPLMETAHFLTEKEWETHLNLPQNSLKSLNHSRIFKQTLTHQNIQAIFYTINEKEFELFFPKKHFKPVEIKNLESLAFPKIIHDYIKEKTSQLSIF